MMSLQFPSTVLWLQSNVGARFLPVPLVRLAAGGAGGDTLKLIKQGKNPTKAAPISESRSGLVTVFGTWQNQIPGPEDPASS